MSATLRFDVVGNAAQGRRELMVGRVSINEPAGRIAQECRFAEPGKDGAGATLGLPLLDASLRRRAAG